jgi:Helix-turn-helix of DDE superfamily endonuclease
VLFYRAALPLSRQSLTFVAGIIRRHRKKAGSRWRKLNPGQQALLVLAYLRKGETFAELAAGFGVGTTTAWRYVNETVALLAARAPKLRQAVRDAKKAGYAYVVVDGTLIPVDRVAADRPFYSGKHKKHGDEPAGHRQSRRGHLVGVRGAGRVRARQESRVDLGSPRGTGGRGPGR